MRAFHRKWPTERMAFNGEVLDLRNGAVSEKTLQIFWPPLPTEYVTVFSRRKDTPEVRCDLTDRHTHTHTHRQDDYSNPPVHARRGLIMKVLHY